MSRFKLGGLIMFPNNNKINESSTLIGKYKVLFKDRDINQFLEILYEAIKNSPHYDETKKESDKAIKEIESAYKDFSDRVMKSIKQIGNNLPGV